MMSQLWPFSPAAENSPAPQLSNDTSLRVLLVCEENSLIDRLTDMLKPAVYQIYRVCTCETVLNSQLGRPDLILIDICAPRIGKHVLGRLRGWTTAPIIVMSAEDKESEKAAFLDTGADDVVSKPLKTEEFLARLRAASRRAFGVPRNEVFRAGNLHMDFSKREILAGNQQIRLSATEYDLLKVLASHAGSVRTHYQLIHEVWGGTQYQDALHLLRVTVSNLRRKLVFDSEPLRHIVTQPGIGYRFRIDPHAEQGTDASQSTPDRKPTLIRGSFLSLSELSTNPVKAALNSQSSIWPASNSCRELPLLNGTKTRSF